MERSDEDRRIDGLYDRIGSLRQTNREQSEKITKLELIIVKTNNATKEQIAAIQIMIVNLQISNNKSFEQIGDDLKLVKLHFC